MNTPNATQPGPSIPAAAPSKPAAPSPAPAAPAPSPQTSTHEVSGDTPVMDLWKDLDATVKPKPSNPVAKAESEPQEAHEEGEAEPQEAPEAPEATKTPPEGEKLATAKPVTAPKALRDQLSKIETELKAEREAKTALEAKIKDWEEKGKDTTVLTERLATREKEIADMRAEMAALKQETSPEFKAKYDVPFDRAAAYAKQTIEQMRTINPETGEQDGRPGTMADLSAIYNLPYADAKAKAKAMFGEDASVIMEHYNQLKRLNYEREVALGEEKKSWETKAKEREAEEVKQREFLTSAREIARKGIVEANPELYAPVPDDAEGNEILAKGWAAVDAPARTAQEHVLWIENVRARAASQPREVYRRQKAEAKVAELEGIIAKMKGNAPGKGGKPSAGPAPAKEMSFKEAAMAELL